MRKRSAIQPAVNWLSDAVVVLAGHRRIARDPVGGLGVADVEKLARDEPPLDPPLVGVDGLAVVGGNRQHELRGFGYLVGAAQQLHAAEDVDRVATGIRRHRIEQRLGVGRLLDHRDARLGKRERVAADAVGSAQAAVGVLRVEPHVHAGLVVGVGEQVAEDVERLAFQVAREVVVAPSVAHQALRTGAVALQQKRAGERELALGGERAVLAEIARTAPGSSRSCQRMASARRAAGRCSATSGSR